MALHNLNLSASFFATAILLYLVLFLIATCSGQKCSSLFASRFFFFPSLIMLASAICGWSGGCNFTAPSFLCFGSESIGIHIDGLASLFIGLLGIVGIALSFFSPGYLERFEKRINPAYYWPAISMFMISMTLVLTCTNAISFIVFWEVMSVSSFALVASEHKHRRVQYAAIVYLGATRIATAFVVAGFLWMYAVVHSWTFTAWYQSPATIGPAMLMLIGFYIKAGSWPCHLWLPYAYPAAPAPVSALMSGVMVKVVMYAIIRILVMQSLSSPMIGYLTLFLGTVSALWGILFTVVQSDLKRLLAYSSVENVGIILMGIGLCILARSQSLNILAELALTASIFHSLNHGLFKTLLFLGAGAVDASTHTRDIGQLGGLGHKMPWTMSTFILGSATICAFPPLNGFASKYLLYQALLQSAWQSHGLWERWCGLTAIGTLALVGGLAVASFTKAVGITFLGNPRSSHASHAKEASQGMIFAQLMLATICVAVGLSASLIVQKLQILSAQILKLPQVAESYFSVPVLQFTLMIAVVAAAIYFYFIKPSKMRKFITWDCGFGDLTPRTQATAVSFVQPVARIFSAVLRFKLLVEISGRDRKNFPDHIKVEPQMVSLLETLVYLPTISWIQNMSKGFAKLQAGSIHLYLLYVCATLVVLMLIGTKL